MKITSNTELMHETRRARRLSPDKDFAACKTTDGAMIYFSIGGDGVFWVTSEIPAGRLGWVELDLSTQLARNHNVSRVVAKTFSVAENGASLSMALVITAEGNDYLYVCELANRATSFDTPSPVLPWKYVVLDAPGPLDRPTIMAGVFVVKLPTSGVNILVDVVRHPQGAFNEVDRYLVTPEAGSDAHWRPRPLPMDFSGETVVTVPGKTEADSYPAGGVYTFGSVGDGRELVYTQLYSHWDPDLPAFPIRLSISSTATAIASTSPLSFRGSEIANTRVYIADGKGISVFIPGLTSELANPILLLSSISLGTELLSGISSLKVTAYGNRTYLWGINGAGVLFQTSCLTQSQDIPSEWNPPTAVWYGAQKIAVFLNPDSLNSPPGERVFATTFTGELREFTRKPEAIFEWVSRPVALYAMHASRVVQLDGFVTAVSVKDDADLPPKQSVLVTVTTTGSKPTPVYVNDEFRVVEPGSALVIPTDSFGNLCISQETKSLGVGHLHATASYDGEQGTVDFNYFASASAKLDKIKTGEDLDGVQVNVNGEKRPLLDSSISKDDKDRAAAAIQSLMAIRADMRKQASVKTSAVLTSTPWDKISDFFDDLASKISGFFATTVYDGLKTSYHLSIQFATGFFNAIIETTEQVWTAIEGVLAKIKVVWETVAAWIAFIYDVEDIRRTHSVLRTMLRAYASRVADTMGSLQNTVADGASKLHDLMTSLEGTQADHSVTDQAKSHKSGGGSMYSAPVQIILSQFRWNIQFAKPLNPSSDDSRFQALLDQLKPILEQMRSDIQNKALGVQINTLASSLYELVSGWGQLNPVSALKSIAGIVAQMLVDAGAVLLNSLVSMLKLVTSLIIVLLDTEIEVPVLQQAYYTIAGYGSTFTVLDILCLVAACPVTEMYKLVVGETPFGEGQETSDLINAADYRAFGRLVKDDLASRMDIVAAMTACIGKLVAVVTGEVKDVIKALSFGHGQWIIGGLAVTATLLVACPSFPPAFRYSAGTLKEPWDRWDFMNDYLTTVAVGKAVFDNLPFAEDLLIKVKYGDVTGPALDSVINVAWLVQVAACVAVTPIAERTASSYVAMVANILLCLSGALGPVTNEAIGKGAKLVKLLINGLLLESGCFDLMTASLLQDERVRG